MEKKECIISAPITWIDAPIDYNDTNHEYDPHFGPVVDRIREFQLSCDSEISSQYEVLNYSCSSKPVHESIHR
jgi:hypothetical protein